MILLSISLTFKNLSIPKINNEIVLIMRIQGLCLALILVSTSIFSVSWLTKHAVNEDRRLNYKFRKTVLFIADLPTHVKSLIGHYSQYVFTVGSPDSYSDLKVDGDFSSSDGGYILGSSLLSVG